MFVQKLIYRPEAITEEGTLCIAEAPSKIVPFDIKRVYFCYGVSQNTMRGRHAHKTLDQVLVCISGKIEISTDDGRGSRESIILQQPYEALSIPHAVWHTMEWLEDNSILLVLASDHYNETDYIRNYDDFIKWAKER